jgi:hypothetical protein
LKAGNTTLFSVYQWETLHLANSRMQEILYYC